MLHKRAQTWTFMAIGLVFWLAGVAVIKLTGAWFFDGGARHALFFALNFVAGAVAIVGVATLTGRTRHEMLVPTTIIAMVAMLMDGIVVTLDALGVTSIYAETVERAAYSGGVLLFAFWSAFFFALLWHRPRDRSGD